MRRMATIGVYGFDGESFLRRLREADVLLLLVYASAAVSARWSGRAQGDARRRPRRRREPLGAGVSSPTRRRVHGMESTGTKALERNENGTPMIPGPCAVGGIVIVVLTAPGSAIGGAPWAIAAFGVARSCGPREPAGAPASTARTIGWSPARSSCLSVEPCCCSSRGRSVSSRRGRTRAARAMKARHPRLPWRPSTRPG